MSEYNFLEKSFLDQLKQLDWDVVAQGSAFPTDPVKDAFSVLKSEASRA
tara:strand:- start:706 stop:852 length:147 start_codon:yes stop_codon:yes gene_type:complete